MLIDCMLCALEVSWLYITLIVIVFSNIIIIMPSILLSSIYYLITFSWVF